MRLALLRAAHTRWLLLVVALGILVADVLICTVPLYNTFVSDLQLQNAMTRADSVQHNMQVTVRITGVSQSVSQKIASTVQGEADQYLSSFTTPHPTAYVTSSPFFMYQRLDLSRFTLYGGATIQLDAFDYTELRPYLHFIQGAPPQTPQQKPSAGKRAQVMITHEMAAAEGIKVGQTITLQTISTGLPANVTATVSGIFEPINENDPFWNGFTFKAVQPTNDFQPTIYPVFTTTDSFYSALSGAQTAPDDDSAFGMTQSWIYHTNLSQITAANMADVSNDVTTFRSRLFGDLGHQYGVDAFGGLDKIIASVQQQLSLVALPLYVIAAQVVGLALLFVAAMAALLIDQQREEIATLKSRGASGAQMLGIFTTQSTALGLLAALAGPFLAMALALLLMRWFLPGAAVSGATASGVSGFTSALTSAYLARVAQPALVLAPAIIGAVLGIAVVTLYALQTARLDMLALRREAARPSHQPFWRRTYLDVGLALLCAVGYLELGRFGGAQTRLNLGATANSPLLLLTPALLLLAGGLLLLRVIPLAARAGARLASRGRGFTSMLTFAQIERTPDRYARMTLLLILAVGLGLFALTFEASLAQNVQDRTAYAAGADFRLTANRHMSASQTTAYLTYLKTLPGVVGVTSLYRMSGITPVLLGDLPVEMLGVDSETFAGVANARSWRADYASQSLPDLMGQLAAHRAPTSAAFDTTTHPLPVLASETLAQQMKLRVGERFQLGSTLALIAPPTLIVSAIVRDFPTLYPTATAGGFLVMDLRDLELAAAAQLNADANSQINPNEFWLRATNSSTGQQALLQALNHKQSDVTLASVESYQQDLRVAEDNPVTGGISGLLVIGAITAALLAVLGSLVQAIMAARQRTTQFAIFRTLGMANRQLAGLLLGEQTFVYLFGLVGGTLLGLLLTTATTPFLTYSDLAINPAAIGTPPYLPQTNWSALGLFYGALLLAFVLALVIASRYAASIGLGRALRLGKD
jgi:ABC-type lipoprotein release transport system permease subunit